MDLVKTTNLLLSLEEKIVKSGISRRELEQLIAAEFLEFGSSGKTYDKNGVIDALAEMPDAKTRISDFKINFLADGVVLATYTASKISDNDKIFTLRSSVWMYKNNRWQIVFHQGTVCR
jgi:hypothetical protein